MTKNNIKDYMIVETGFYDKKYLIINGKLLDDNLQGFSLEDDFNDDLVNNKNKLYSISKVFESVKIRYPLELDIESLFKNQNPKVIWERKPTKLSKNILNKMKKSEMQRYLMNQIYPCVIVE